MKTIPLKLRAVAAVSALFDGTRIGNAIDTLFDRYEGAQPNTPNRSWIPNFVRDPRYDITSFTRWELTRKVRYFEANNWLVQRLADLFEQYVAGPNGLQVMPDSSDADWNKKALASWQTWCQYPDISSRQPFSTLQGLIARSWFIDGDIFILKTFGRERPGKQAFPRIQLVESHRVSSPGQQYAWASDMADNFDGVKIDQSTGRPVGYYMRSDFDGKDWSLKDANDVIHVFEPSRPGQLRGITFFHSVLNNLHDMDDLQSMEMQRAKQQTEIANVFETYSGELDTRNNRLNMIAGRGTANNNQPDKDWLARVAQYKTILGSRTISIKPGEKLTQMNSVQPSAATQWYWDYLTGTVCLGVGISKGLALPTSMQGTVVRQDLSACAGFFRSRCNTLAYAVGEIYKHYMQWARYNDPTLYDAPSDWYKNSITPPQAVDVDNGRNTVATLSNLAAGTTNLTQIYGAQGLDFRTQVRTRVRELIEIKKVCLEESAAAGVKVTSEDFSTTSADTLLKLAQAAQAEALADQAGEPEPKPDEEPIDA